MFMVNQDTMRFLIKIHIPESLMDEKKNLVDSLTGK